MRKIIVQFVRLSAGYSLVTLAGPLLAVVLTPLYTRVLAPSDYAAIDIMVTLTALMVGIATLGMDHVVTSRYFDPLIPSRQVLLRTAFIVIIIVSLVLSGLVILLSPYIASIFLQNLNLKSLPLIISISVFAGPLYVLTGSVLRLQMNIRRVNIFGWCSVLVTLIGNVLLVLVLKMGVAGALTANAAAYVACIVVGAVMLWKDLAGHFDKRLARQLVIAGLAFLPGALSWLIFMNIDRLLLTQYVSMQELGLYSIANKLASMLGFLFTTMWAAWLPMAIAIMEKGQDPKPIVKMFEVFGGLSMVMALGIGVFAPEILAVFTQSMYVPAAPYAMALMAYAGPIMFMGSFFTIDYYVEKTIHILAICAVVSAVLNVILNLVLNPKLGIWGAVIATVVAGFIRYFVAAMLRRQARVQYRIDRMLVLFALYAVAIYAIASLGRAIDFGAKAIVVSVYLIVVAVALVPSEVVSRWAGSIRTLR